MSDTRQAWKPRVAKATTAASRIMRRLSGAEGLASGGDGIYPRTSTGQR